MAHVSKTIENNRGKHQALSFNLPVLIFLAQLKNFLSDVHNAFWVVFSDWVQNIEGVYSHVSFRVSEANQSIVQEHIEPLLIEFLFLANQVRLTCINSFIIRYIAFKVLDYFDSEVEVMLSVTVY